MSNSQDLRDGLLSDHAAYEHGVTGSSSSINSEPKPQSFCGKFMQKVFKGDIKVALYALGLLISSTGNSIFFKKMSNKMTNYPFFLSQLTSFVYLPIFFSIVWYEMKFTNYITPEMTKFPKKKFLFMGLFDALSGIFMLFGGIHTSGSYQALLLNAVIPFTMALSILALRTRYLLTQYLGATIIMAGVAVVMVPNVLDGDSSDNSVLFNFIFLLSTVPQAFSSIYKELAFGDIDLDVNYLQAWVAFFQFFLGCFLAPLNALPFLKDAYIPFDQLPYTISNGAKCFAGVNTVVNYTVTDLDGFTHGTCWLDEKNKWGAPSDTHCDDCSGAWAPTLGYIIFNCFYNLFIVLVIKYGSAALLWIILTLRLPLVQIAFALSFINNPPDDFKVTSIIGLFVILGGLVLYRYSSVAGSGTAEGEEEKLTDDQQASDVALLPEDFNQRLTHPSD